MKQKVLERRNFTAPGWVIVDSKWMASAVLLASTQGADVPCSDMGQRGKLRDLLETEFQQGKYFKYGYIWNSFCSEQPVAFPSAVLSTSFLHNELFPSFLTCGLQPCSFCPAHLPQALWLSPLSYGKCDALNSNVITSSWLSIKTKSSFLKWQRNGGWLSDLASQVLLCTFADTITSTILVYFLCFITSKHCFPFCLYYLKANWKNKLYLCWGNRINFPAKQRQVQHKGCQQLSSVLCLLGATPAAAPFTAGFLQCCWDQWSSSFFKRRWTMNLFEPGIARSLLALFSPPTLQWWWEPIRKKESDVCFAVVGPYSCLSLAKLHACGSPRPGWQQRIYKSTSFSRGCPRGSAAGGPCRGRSPAVRGRQPGAQWLWLGACWAGVFNSLQQNHSSLWSSALDLFSVPVKGLFHDHLKAVHCAPLLFCIPCSLVSKSLWVHLPLQGAGRERLCAICFTEWWGKNCICSWATYEIVKHREGRPFALKLFPGLFFFPHLAFKKKKIILDSICRQ